VTPSERLGLPEPAEQHDPAGAEQVLPKALLLTVLGSTGLLATVVLGSLLGDTSRAIAREAGLGMPLELWMALPLMIVFGPPGG
jgi:hypothetical protein